ncbi:MAG: nickel-dependent lactate racemase [Clostridiales bacterium]|jgi:nickel-dependent lactate racemase|nr:nickel-dependent lactate racemase [Clostridiales bacterium]
MRLEVGFGTGVQAFDVPEANCVGVMHPNKLETGLAGIEAVKAALVAPLGSKRLSSIVKPGEKVVIVTSDSTRPMPSKKVLPSVLDELEETANLKDVTVVIALGTHKPHSEEEIRKLVGDESFERVHCVNGDPNDCLRMGVTSSGTPVEITRVVAQADRRVALGNIEFHYFAGYSGGAKAILPGVASRAAIHANHRWMVEDLAAAGRIDDNPVRRDIDEALKFCPLDFIVNVVLDEKKEIVYAISGDPIKAHREGCRFLNSYYAAPLEKRADIVIASQGGAPKDADLAQTQKALENAKHAVRDGGITILVGACGKGLGEKVFQEWMTTSPSPDFMIDRIKRDFQLGGHKAASIALALKKFEIYLVSEMDPGLVRSALLQPFSSVQEALDKAFEKLGKDASVLVMPSAGSTLPVVGRFDS